MGEFLLAALPWVVMGVAVAILATVHSKKKSRQTAAAADTEKERKHKQGEDNYMSEGMSIGMCLGVALGSTGLFDLSIGTSISIGISVGMCLGLAIGTCIKKPH